MISFIKPVKHFKRHFFDFISEKKQPNSTVAGSGDTVAIFVLVNGFRLVFRSRRGSNRGDRRLQSVLLSGLQTWDKYQVRITSQWTQITSFYKEYTHCNTVVLSQLTFAFTVRRSLKHFHVKQKSSPVNQTNKRWGQQQQHVFPSSCSSVSRTVQGRSSPLLPVDSPASALMPQKCIIYVTMWRLVLACNLIFINIYLFMSLNHCKKRHTACVVFYKWTVSAHVTGLFV